MSLDLKCRVGREAFSLDASLSLPPKGVSALYGPSGCGKTSLLRAIAGLDKATHGQISFNNSVWQSDDVFVPTHQRELAMVFQEARLFAHLNVVENLNYAFKRVPVEQRRIELDQAIKLLSLSNLLKRRVDGLSGGEQQRVAIARALCASPKLLLMDEPLSALDRNAKREILPYIEGMVAELNLPIVYVSHSLDEVARLADTLVLMEPEGIVAAGDAPSMLTQLDLSLAKDFDAESIVDAQVTAHDDTYQLTYLDSAVGQFSVARKSLAIGTQVRLRVLAKDVSLTLKSQTDTSILNIFPATIREISETDGAQATIKLHSNGVPVLAKVTRKSVDALGLKVGLDVFIQAKSVALL